MMWNHSSWLPFGWHLHMVFAGILLLGAIFLVIVALKVLSKKQLVTWTIALLIVGVIGVLATCQWGWNGFRGMMSGLSFRGELSEERFDEMHEEMEELMEKYVDEDGDGDEDMMEERLDEIVE